MAIGEPEIQQVSNQLQLQLAMRIVTCRASGSDTVAAVLQRSASLQTHTPPVHSIRTGSATAWTVDMSRGAVRSSSHHPTLDRQLLSVWPARDCLMQ